MAHTYWRIYITANDGNTSGQKMAIMEVEMRSTWGGADQCTGGTPSASSQSAGFEASKAFDDNTSTNQWICNSSDGSGPWWIRYEFASSIDIVEIVIWPPTTLNRAPKDFDFQYSDDGSSWTTLFSVTGQTGWSAGVSRTFGLPQTLQGNFFLVM